MSLVNDALRRAKAAQQQTPSSTHTELRFRPVDCSVVPRRSNVRWYILGFFLLLICAGCVFFQYFDGRNFLKSSLQAVQARSTVDQPPPAADPAPVVKAPPVQPAPRISNPPAQVANVESAAATTNTPIAAPEPALPPVAVSPEPKLQAIFFSPPNPSAMINGKTFFVGDKIGEFKLAAVDQQTATLVGAGKTNVLALP